MSNPTLGEKSLTGRGFSILKFNDSNGIACSMQTSSALDFSHCDEGDYECMSRPMLWLGPDGANPRIKAWDAMRMGLPTNGATTGWVDYSIPDEVLLTTRMHLRVPQVKALIAELQEWLESEGEG
ncbi:hypothetical protein Xoosp13_171 [Xanthomonas phage Xoo-sp13]|nr:hypothetical protein Xoosp13_171 [Xanthomonas phage Xoo-sp13]